MKQTRILAKLLFPLIWFVKKTTRISISSAPFHSWITNTWILCDSTAPSSVCYDGYMIVALLQRTISVFKATMFAINNHVTWAIWLSSLQSRCLSIWTIRAELHNLTWPQISMHNITTPMEYSIFYLFGRNVHFFISKANHRISFKTRWKTFTRSLNHASVHR